MAQHGFILDPNQKATLLAIPILGGAILRILLGFLVANIGAKKRAIIAQLISNAVITKNRSFRYYIMEYIKGERLKERISKKPIHIDEVIKLAKFLLKASNFLLKFNLVHGDIKPENIIITKPHNKEVFKLVDFSSIVEIFSITSRAGTPRYLAP